MELLWLIALIVVTLSLSGVIVFLVISHAKEKEELHNRLMSRDYADYKYFKDDFPEELKHRSEMLKKEREKPPLTGKDKILKDKAAKF